MALSVVLTFCRGTIYAGCCCAPAGATYWYLSRQTSPVVIVEEIQSIPEVVTEVVPEVVTMVVDQVVEPAVTTVLDFVLRNRRSFAWGAAIVCSKVFLRISGIEGRCIDGVCRLAKSIRDRIVSRCSFRSANASKRRLLFNTKFMLQQSTTHKGHSHGSAAANRTGASWSIDDYIMVTGARGYTVSFGARDDGVGQRLYYHIRDFALKAQDDPILPNDIIKMIDVDYYADMDYWLSFGRPILCYTFVPTKAGGTDCEASYSFANNNVQMIVNGGGRFEHELWDFDHDYITVDTLAGVWLVSVDQKLTNADCRRVVQLTPTAWVPAPFSLLVPRNPLRRRKISHGPWSQVVHQQDNGSRTVSVAREGSSYAVTIPAELYNAIVVRHNSSKNKNISDIERYLRKFSENNTWMKDQEHIAASLLFDFFMNG